MLRWYQELGAHRVLQVVTSAQLLPGARTGGAAVVVGASEPGAHRVLEVAISTEPSPLARTGDAAVVVGAGEPGAHRVVEVVASIPHRAHGVQRWW